MVVLAERGFEREDYARYHAAASLGRKLLSVEEVKNGDVMFAKAEVFKRLAQRFGGKEQIRDNHNEGSLPDFFGGFVNGADETCFASRGQGSDLIENDTEVARPPTGRRSLVTW